MYDFLLYLKSAAAKRTLVAAVQFFGRCLRMDRARSLLGARALAAVVGPTKPSCVSKQKPSDVRADPPYKHISSMMDNNSPI